MPLNLIPDLTIVGAGIAGLHTGIEYLRKNPTHRVVILEEYNYIGGRMVTYKKKGNQWENGAGRIHRQHKLVGQLVDKYGLTRIPFTDNIKYLDITDSRRQLQEVNFASSPILSQLQSLPPKVLQTNTICNLLQQTIGYSKTAQLLSRFPYYSETYYMRADLALSNLLKDELSTYSNYYGIAEGIQEITNKMAVEFESLGGEIRKGCKVLNVSSAASESPARCQLIVKKTADSTAAADSQDVTIKLFAAKVVLAVHSAALKGLFPQAPVLKHLVMTPLLRIYAVFPKGSAGAVWFKSLPKIVTNSPLRFIIPISEENGTIMISYTDADDTYDWMRFTKNGDEAQLTKSIMIEVRKLFKGMQIPNPTFIKAHPWTWGTTYWLPGLYDPHKESVKALQVAPNIYVCGESYSMRQSWMEGALEHSNMLLDILSKR